MNIQAGIGHNNAPDPLDEALAPYSDFITEAESWLDGEYVTTEEQMKAVDEIAKQVKKAKKAATDAQKSEAAPLHDAWKAALARYKPTIEDLDRMAKGLATLVSGFKKKLAAEKAEAERLAHIEAEKKLREAEAAARKACAADIEGQREALAKIEEAKAATKAAAAAKKDASSVKGLRTVTKYEITDHRAALHWIAARDREAMTQFIEQYVRQNHKTAQINGVRVWQDKEAF
jgi:hypothetical protein